MQDNSTNAAAEMLIKYIDGELDETEKTATEQLLQNDAALQERYKYFLAAKQAIRLQGVKQRVGAIQQEYLLETNDKDAKNIKVNKPFSIAKNLMRIAAVLILVIGGYGLFQYFSTTNQSVYNDNFMSYQLPVNRSNEQTAASDELYVAGDYNAVINAFNKKQQKQQKDYFIAAQAYLQLGNANTAIDAFKQVENINNNSSEKSFTQETDYYLMLAYIKAGRIEEATQRLDKITADKHHLFYSKTNKISRTKLKILQWKE